MTMPSHSAILAEWKQWLMRQGIDIGEPSCWACGYFWWGRYDPDQDNPTEAEIAKAWNAAPLQRCHIVPRALGGDETAANLFLMCKECHDKAPNTSSREAFLTWAVSQNWVKRLSKEVFENLAAFGLDQQDYDDLTKIIASADFKEWFTANASLHRSQSNAGSKLTIASLVAGVVEYRRARALARGEGRQSSFISHEPEPE